MRLATTDPGEGTPTVLLHGQPGNGGDWEPVSSRLRSRLRVLAPDRPGYGRTGGSAAGFGGNADAVVALLDRLGIESAVLAGHSWGTGVALATAIRYPHRVRALVLIAPVSPNLPSAAVDRLFAHPLLGPPATWLAFGLVGATLALPPARRLAASTVPALSAEQVAATAARWRSGSVWRSFHAEQRALIGELPTLAPGLASIEQPVTVLSGTRDRVAPPAHAKDLIRALPNARLVEAEGAGHMLPQQRPELVAEAIAAATSTA